MEPIWTIVPRVGSRRGVISWVRDMTEKRFVVNVERVSGAVASRAGVVMLRPALLIR